MAENDSYQTPSVPSSKNKGASSAASLRSPAEDGWHSPAQGGITTPIAPDCRSCAADSQEDARSGDYGLTTPVAPEGGRPTVTPEDRPIPPGSGNNKSGSTDGDYGLTTPVAPEGGRPVAPGWPVTPSFPSTYYGQVRFLNASTNHFPVNFSIDGITYGSGFGFGDNSLYQEIADGFHTVSVTSATAMGTLLLQQTFPFAANQKVTMVLVDAREGGLEMIQVPDTGCRNLPSGYGCYRVVNASYSGSSFDVRLYNGDTVFRNLQFTNVSPYKRALAGNYTFYLTSANFYSVIRELPVILITAVTNMNPMSTPLASANVSIQADTNTTSYIIGNTWSAYPLQMLTLND